jgi:hypothetical protein
MRVTQDFIRILPSRSGEAEKLPIDLIRGIGKESDRSYGEALENIEDAIRLYLEDRLAIDEPIPRSEMVSFNDRPNSPPADPPWRYGYPPPGECKENVTVTSKAQ